MSRTPEPSSNLPARLAATLWPAAGLIGVSVLAAGFWTLIAALATPWSAGTLATIATSITAFLMLACSPLMLADAGPVRASAPACTHPRHLA